MVGERARTMRAMKPSDLFLLEGKSNRKALRCAAVLANDLSLIVSLNHLSALFCE